MPPAPGAPDPPRTPDLSVTTMTELILPTHANSLGSVFGGQILAWVDLCAAICAQRHTGYTVTTAGIDELSFERPIQVGQVVCIIEAMKLMNEIEADVSGEVVRSLVENGQPVEYGQALFAIRPAKKK